LRTAALPGMSAALSLAAHPRLLASLWDVGGRLRSRGVRQGAYVQAVARALRPLERAQAREAFLQTLRAVIDVRGQRVSATDRLYLLESMPTMIVWGARDHTIPLEHGRRAHEAIPHSRFRTLPGAAHFPHLEDPEALVAVLREFLEESEPCEMDDADWGALLSRSALRRRRLADAAA
jgi:pimeloyl-ACP methyl ester carboxylesterase